MKASERFLQYVLFDTTSCEENPIVRAQRTSLRLRTVWWKNFTRSAWKTPGWTKTGMSMAPFRQTVKLTLRPSALSHTWTPRLTPPAPA